MLTSEEKLNVMTYLKKCDNMKQVLDYVTKHYQIENCDLSMITKPIIIEGMIKTINLLNAKRR